MMRLARVSKRERAENLAAALEACALTERADDRVMTLSTGLKQRANIARALAARPELLLLDEPTSGLDPAAAQKVYDTLIDLQTTGITFIICTHLMQEADDLCDRVLFLNTGRILVDGPPDEVRKSAGDIVYTIPANDDADLAAKRGLLRTAGIDRLVTRRVNGRPTLHVYGLADSAAIDVLGMPFEKRPVTLSDAFILLAEEDA